MAKALEVNKNGVAGEDPAAAPPRNNQKLQGKAFQVNKDGLEGQDHPAQSPESPKRGSKS